MIARFFRYWVPVVLWMFLVFGASTSLGRPENTSRFIRPLLHFFFPKMTERTFAKVHYTIRKSAHFAEYGMLGLLVWRWLYYEPLAAACRSRIYATALLICALYAASDEFHQLFVPGRQAAVHDVLLDTSGAAFGLLLLWIARRLSRRDERV